MSGKDGAGEGEGRAGLQSCNRWEIVYSATMQSSSQLLSGSYSGSYMTEGLFVHQSDSLWIEAVGQSAGPGADGNGIFVQRAIAGRDGALGGSGGDVGPPGQIVGHSHAQKLEVGHPLPPPLRLGVESG